MAPNYRTDRSLPFAEPTAPAEGLDVAATFVPDRETAGWLEANTGRRWEPPAFRRC